VQGRGLHRGGGRGVGEVAHLVVGGGGAVLHARGAAGGGRAGGRGAALAQLRGDHPARAQQPDGLGMLAWSSRQLPHLRHLHPGGKIGGAQAQTMSVVANVSHTLYSMGV